MRVGELATLRTARMVGGVPMLPIVFSWRVSFWRGARYDQGFPPDYSLPTIQIDEFPHDAPCTRAEHWRLPRRRSRQGRTRTRPAWLDAVSPRRRCAVPRYRR